MNEPGSTGQEDRDRTLVFRLGAERFGLPLARVVEVFELSAPLVSVPGAPLWLGGVINHHGRVIPVLRMSKFMEVSSAEEAGQIILMEVSGESLGLAVDQIESLEEVRAEGPVQQGRKRSWHRGALMELIDPEFLEGSIKQRLAEIGREAII